MNYPFIKNMLKRTAIITIPARAAVIIIGRPTFTSHFTPVKLVNVEDPVKFIDIKDIKLVASKK